MGRRKKAAKKVVKKKRLVVSKTFKCLFCSEDKSVVCGLDIKTFVGRLSCNVCGASYSSKINTLTEPIDFYHEWLDKTAHSQAQASRKFLREHQQGSRPVASVGGEGSDDRDALLDGEDFGDDDFDDEEDGEEN